MNAFSPEGGRAGSTTWQLSLIHILADMKKAGQPAEYMDGEAFAAYIAGQQAHAQEAISAAGLLKK